MNTNGLSYYLNKWVVAGALAIGILLCLFIGAVLWLLGPSRANPEASPVEFTVIPAPTATPTVSPFLTLFPTATEAAYVSPEGITIGAYVQISGTGGDGLRLRAAPGTDAELLFIGMEAEVFEVRDGPREANDFTWWYLVAPYDENRSGWAASRYLQVVSPPQ
jgi:hypothetical protein